jgi:hypothetical protein
MIQLSPDLFGITIDIRFPTLRPFAKERLDRLLSRLIDPEHGLALRNEQLRVRPTDVGFDYDLKAFFLGGNAVLVYDAEKFFLSVSGGRTQADANLLRETAKRFLWTGEISDQDSGIFSASTHARSESIEKREEFLKRFRPSDEVTGPGALGFVRIPSWSEEIRFSLEPSLNLAGGLYLAWTMPFHGVSWLSSLEELTNALESTASIFGVQFKPIAAS